MDGMTRSGVIHTIHITVILTILITVIPTIHIMAMEGIHAMTAMTMTAAIMWHAGEVTAHHAVTQQVTQETINHPIRVQALAL
jgi:predicted metal-dependent hydrolase